MKVPRYKPQPYTANRYKKTIQWELIRRDGAECRRCGEKREYLLTIDHIVQRSQGGTDDLENLQILCRECHDIKDLIWPIREATKEQNTFRAPNTYWRNKLK